MKSFKIEKRETSIVDRYQMIPSMCCSRAFLFIEDGEAKYFLPDGEEAYVIDLPGIPPTPEWMLLHFGEQRAGFTDQLGPMDYKSFLKEASGASHVQLPSDICGKIGCIQLQETPYMVYLSDTYCSFLLPGDRVTDAVVFSASLAGPTYSTVGDLPRIEAFFK